MIDNHVILNIHISGRNEKVPKLQEAFTNFGCYIKTRVGLHDVSDDFCSSNGIIILEMINEDKASELETLLASINGVEVKKILFKHEANNDL